MKLVAKRIIILILGWQVRRLQRKYKFKVIAVVGSIGKTSTKLAVAQMLEQKFKVQYQKGNYNDIVTVPLVVFGRSLPSLLNPIEWFKIFVTNEKQIRAGYKYDVVVLELGTDRPGDISSFKSYINSDITVVTAVAPEHMEFFGHIDDVAKEELSAIQFSASMIINSDLLAKEYSSLIQESITYGLHQPSDYRINDYEFSKQGVSFSVQKDQLEFIKSMYDAISEMQLYSVLAGITVCDNLGMTKDEIISGINKITPVSGRLQLLAGINNSTIIDDTYNASPDAMKAAINTLYQIDAPQKIALLGNMNELGKHSETANKEIGDMCDPGQISEVITLGPDANKFLAVAAEERGCKVTKFDTPYDAGNYIKSVLKPGSLVLAKGSQNKVYAEEAVKIVLANPDDSAKLVRQSEDWIIKKSKSFQ